MDAICPHVPQAREVTPSATAHFHAQPDHPLIRSFEPGEDWWWCYSDEAAFEVPGAAPAPSYSTADR